MPRSRTTAALILTSALALTACGASDADSADYTLRFASYTTPTAAESIASEEWAQRIHERTDGRVEIEFYYQESLLAGVETLQGVADGRADAGFIAGAYYPAELPLSNVAGIPFVTEDAEAQAHAFEELYDGSDELRQEWEGQGVHVMSWAPISANLVAMTEPIETFSDLRGRQIRGYGYVSEALSLAGANAMGIAQGEVYEALQRGVLDGTSGASLDIAVYRDFHEVAPHFYDIGFGNYAITANVINLHTWQNLPEDIRGIIDEVNGEYLDIYLETLLEVEEASCDELLESGGTITIFDEEETATWREEAGPAIREVWAADVSTAKPDVDTAAFLTEYLSVLESHEADSDYTSPLITCAARQ
ncbi:C4-dicarboxylate TRAP transporter substrate-binding protein [uncultured Aeromicrobium sp.]|uniref:C4-dicarboxylate TRAP transporter substrate-binding protein n=1 Tax=uncultured Aeromicrobium sp. TaxID=337820 RepID=UPI0025DD91E6|nr:C4-dicarboxylate TRAP transporter substrate-binding protein [uncultured Aeromicrobium sp.]